MPLTYVMTESNKLHESVQEHVTQFVRQFKAIGKIYFYLILTKKRTPITVEFRSDLTLRKKVCSPILAYKKVHF